MDHVSDSLGEFYELLDSIYVIGGILKREFKTNYKLNITTQYIKFKFKNGNNDMK